MRLFLRFKSFPPTDPGSSGADTRLITAVLMEYRERGGRKEQRIVKYLARICEGEIADPVCLHLFWACATAELDELAIDVDERERIEEGLRRTIPRPSTRD